METSPKSSLLREENIRIRVGKFLTVSKYHILAFMFHVAFEKLHYFVLCLSGRDLVAM